MWSLHWTWHHLGQGVYLMYEVFYCNIIVPLLWRKTKWVAVIIISITSMNSIPETLKLWTESSLYTAFLFVGEKVMYCKCRRNENNTLPEYSFWGIAIIGHKQSCIHTHAFIKLCTFESIIRLKANASVLALLQTDPYVCVDVCSIYSPPMSGGWTRYTRNHVSVCNEEWGSHARWKLHKHAIKPYSQH